MTEKEYIKDIKEKLINTFPNEISRIFGSVNKIRIWLNNENYYKKVFNFLAEQKDIYKNVRKGSYEWTIHFEIIIPDELKSDIDKEIEILENKIKELKFKKRNKELEEKKLKLKKQLEEQLKKIDEELKSI